MSPQPRYLNRYAPVFLRCAARAVMRKLLERYPAEAHGSTGI